MIIQSGIFNFNFESFLNDFNNFMPLLFFFLKFILAGMLLLLGSISLLRLKGMYSRERLRNPNIDNSYLFKNSRFILGNVYLVLGIGFIFNFMIYALILIFNLIPDMLIIPLIRSIESIPQEFITDYFINNNLDTPPEVFVNNIIGIVSFLIFFSIIFNIWSLVTNRDFNISKQVIGLGVGVIAGCLFSFSRFLLLFL